MAVRTSLLYISCSARYIGDKNTVGNRGIAHTLADTETCCALHSTQLNKL